MLSYSLRATAFILLSLTRYTRATTVSLLDLMPKCASECLESFISTEYPRNACSTGCDLSYLCTTNTTSGYTLGEAALRCSLSLCSIEVAMSFDTYSICESVPGALPRTHPTIVATITSPGNPTSTVTRPTTVTTMHTETTAIRPTASSTITMTEHTSTTITTFESPTSTIDNSDDSSATRTEEPTTTDPSDSADPTPAETTSDSLEGGLNSGAVIGVSVVSGIAGFFIIGVVIFFCCRKARHRNAQDREFFEIGGHMSEPPDFSFPPKRPPLGPRPSPGHFHADSESARLVPPTDPGHQHPAVIVIEPENDHKYNHTAGNNADRTALYSYSNHDYDAASIASSRTVSDLLPEKPAYDLYPRPLRWSQQKKPRPSSGATFFEEEHHSGSRELPSPPIPKTVLSDGSPKGRNRPPLAGLPANPRAMMHGFGGPAIRTSGQGKKPAYAAAQEDLQPSNSADLRQNSPYQSSHIDYVEDVDNYHHSSDAGFVGAKVIQPPRPNHSTGTPQTSFDNYPGYDFEFDLNINKDPGPESRGASRHSGSFRPLTPVREIRTPTAEVRNPIGEGPSKYGAARYPLGSSLGPHDQPQEMISRPRIIRQDDIKRVQIRRGKPSPKEVTVPYCPDDYWSEQSSEPSGTSGYNIPRKSVEYKYTAEMMGRMAMPKKKPSPSERNLTPSRRGTDLILQVE
ncbi:hypothetical protein BJY04DRAFT_92724 [Aspergillus karnatakaensis]|uniref:uncharacterized protein n=1 Tax=Aspergillus karnatakaensis TaxID=1810916 RepID=UPI003CCD8A94